jgi:hypothetical protein
MRYLRFLAIGVARLGARLCILDIYSLLEQALETAAKKVEHTVLLLSNIFEIMRWA